MLELVFVHVPKCAGTALTEGLRAAWPGDAAFGDFDDSPANPISVAALDPAGSAERFARDAPVRLAGAQIAHGHMHAAKYAAVAPGAAWITVLRHPVERAISHFFYWKEPRAWNANPLREHVAGGLGLEAFARLPIINGFYRNVFFRGLERAQFAHVGRSEALAETLEAIARLTGRCVESARTNLGAARATPEAQAQAEAARPRLHELLAEDIAFYEAWTRA